jgi:excisionase family DNA binding protein
MIFDASHLALRAAAIAKMMFNNPVPGGEVSDEPEKMTSTEMTLEQAAERLGVHYMSAYRYVRTGRLPARQVGGRWAVDAKDLDQFLAIKAGPGSTAPTPGSRDQDWKRSAERTPTALADRLEQGDEGGAWQILEEHAVATKKPGARWVSFLADAMTEIGDRWASGTTSIGEEHQASVVAMRLIGRLSAQGRRRGRRKGTVILGAAPGDRHGLPTAMASEVLRSNGFTVIDLGADVPADQMWQTAIDTDRLLAVGYCATSELDELSTLELRDSITQVTDRVGCPVFVGGAAITAASQVTHLGAQLWTSSVDELLEATERLHTSGPNTSEPTPP